MGSWNETVHPNEIESQPLRYPEKCLTSVHISHPSPYITWFTVSPHCCYQNQKPKTQIKRRWLKSRSYESPLSKFEMWRLSCIMTWFSWPFQLVGFDITQLVLCVNHTIQGVAAQFIVLPQRIPRPLIQNSDYMNDGETCWTRDLSPQSVHFTHSWSFLSYQSYVKHARTCLQRSSRIGSAM